MAQGTGADGLIALSIRVAGAGVILALAAAVVLAISGCGGGSDDTEAESTASPATAAGATGSTPAGGSAGNGTTGSGSLKRGASAQADPASRSSSTAGGSTSGSGKRGPRVAMPSGEPEPGITPEQREQATVASIALTSSALEPTVGSALRLPGAYTCDGKDSWPQLSWQGVPSGTVELALLAMSMKPVEGKIFYDWAVAGVDPSLSGIEAGHLPKGAVMGRNSFGDVGYSICPPQGSEETYIFALFALPKALSPTKGFDPAALREEALQIAGNGGLMAVSYARG